LRKELAEVRTKAEAEAQARAEEKARTVATATLAPPAIPRRPSWVERLRGPDEAEQEAQFDRALEATSLRMKLDAELEKARSLEELLINERQRFEETTQQLKSEVDRLRQG